MTWKWPRFSIRQMMIAVAIAAVVMFAIEAVIVKRRQMRYLKTASAFETAERSLRDAEIKLKEQIAASRQDIKENLQRLEQIAAITPDGSDPEIKESLEDAVRSGSEIVESEAKGLSEEIAYYALLKRKYQQAAAHPWLPLPPDPPMPP